MMLGVTALDVALVSAIAAALAVVVQPLTALVVTTLTQRHERWLHQYNDLRDACLELLALGFDRRLYLDQIRAAIKAEEEYMPEAPSDAAEKTAAAKVNAFASDEVIRAWNAFQDAAFPENMEFEIGTPEERKAALTELDRLIKDLDSKLEDLRNAVRRDLVGERKARRALTRG
jgi:hypothetical protein